MISMGEWGIRSILRVDFCPKFCPSLSLGLASGLTLGEIQARNLSPIPNNNPILNFSTGGFPEKKIQEPATTSSQVHMMAFWWLSTQSQVRIIHETSLAFTFSRRGVTSD